MKLYIKQKMFSLKEKFYIYDSYGNERFYAVGKVFSWGKKFKLYTSNGQELVYVHEKVLSWLPKYHIEMNGKEVAEVDKKWSLFKKKLYVKGVDWNVKGDFLSHEYEITNSRRIIARIRKKWFTWADTYEIDIEDDKDVYLALTVVLVIDAILQDEITAATTTTTTTH